MVVRSEGIDAVSGVFSSTQAQNRSSSASGRTGGPWGSTSAMSSSPTAAWRALRKAMKSMLAMWLSQDRATSRGSRLMQM